MMGLILLPTRFRNSNIPSFQPSIIPTSFLSKPITRFGEIGRKKIFYSGAAKTFREKGADEVAPVLFPDNRNFGDLLVVLGHKADIAPVVAALPAAKIVENE
jgi:hypothetical protein